MAKNHPLYHLYYSIKMKCNNPKNPSYKNFGAKGITLCEEWEKGWLPFYGWCMSNGWEKGLFVERKNFAEEYSPDNCFISTESCHQSKIMKDIQLELWSDPEYKAMMILIRKEMYKTPEWQKAKSEGQLRAFSDIKVLEKISKTCKKTWKTRSRKPWNTEIFKRMMSCVGRECAMEQHAAKKKKGRKEKIQRAIDPVVRKRVNTYSGVITAEDYASL